MNNYHQPVLLNESIKALQIITGGVYVDATFGGGGHSREILKYMGTGKLIAFDQDTDAIKNKVEDERFFLIHANFSYLSQILKFHKATPVDGVLADLGVSSHQFDTPQRGFSIRYDGVLDMRMNTASKLTAYQVIAEYPGEKLQSVFSQYGEIINSKTLAETIVAARETKKINTTTELKQVTEKCIRGYSANDYYAKMFQALRIEVNDELGSLTKFLLQCGEVIRPGGRLVIISYHSLEDRLVKNYIRTGKPSGEVEKNIFGVSEAAPFKAITKKPITPENEELKNNPRSRSAKLRVAERI